MPFFELIEVMVASRSEFLVLTELVASIEVVAQSDVIAFIEVDDRFFFDVDRLVVAFNRLVLEGFEAFQHDRTFLFQKLVDLLVRLSDPGLEVNRSHFCSPGSAEPSRE